MEAGPPPFRTSLIPRTVLSSVNAAENRTAVLVRREMQSWRRLRLEPAAMHEPDTFATPPRLGSDGSHLAAALFHLAHGGAAPLLGLSKRADEPDPTTTYARVANRLSDLIDDVREVGVEVDSQRELWTLFARGMDGTKHPARALSDGTLRFLALAVIELDPAAQGMLCLEEPENGIHPERIPAMLRLLKEIATVTDDPIGPDNPLRQVVVDADSPAVVSEVDEESLLFAQLHEDVKDGQRFRASSSRPYPVPGGPREMILRKKYARATSSFISAARDPRRTGSRGGDSGFAERPLLPGQGNPQVPPSDRSRRLATPPSFR